MKNERQDQIIKILEKQGYASVKEMSEQVFASLATIRRDLSELEMDGFVVRCHGGAKLNCGSKDVPYGFRTHIKAAEKYRMCRFASTFVKDGDTIFIDGSSTCLRIIEFLREYENITVITNSLKAANLLMEYGINFYCTGGEVRRSSFCFVGRRAELFISDFHADIMFFSTSGLNSQGFVTDYSSSETDLRKTMLQFSEKKVLLCDCDKFGKNYMYNVCRTGDIDVIITDKKPDGKFIAVCSNILSADQQDE